MNATTNTKDRIEVWKEEPGWKHPYPWRFRVHFQGQTWEFGGVPNQCHSRRSAIARATWRLRWLRSGMFDRHYGVRPPANPRSR